MIKKTSKFLDYLFITPQKAISLVFQGFSPFAIWGDSSHNLVLFGITFNSKVVR